MGPVGAAVVTATFYSFSPDLIGEVIPRAWTLASPEAIVAARWRVADTALRRMLGDRVDSPEVAQAAELIRRATARCAATSSSVNPSRHAVSGCRMRATR
jgi:hypothetical protein